jgi:hypothetical protein
MATYAVILYQSSLTLSLEQLLNWTGGTLSYLSATTLRIQMRNGGPTALPDDYDLLLTGTFTAVGGLLTGGTVTSISGQDALAGSELSRLNSLSIDVTPLLIVGSPFSISSPNLNAVMGNADTLTGSTMGDTLMGYGGGDSIVGAEGDDSLLGLNGMDTINGGDGLDTILGGTGNDSLSGGLGNDIVSGEQDNDILFGDRGDDILYGQSGDDTLHGGRGNDTLDGGNGENSFYGEEGDDLLILSDDPDSTNFPVIDGGDGNDTLFITALSPVNIRFSLTGVENIDFGGNIGQTLTATIGSTAFDAGGILHVYGRNSVNILRVQRDTPDISVSLLDLEFTNWQDGLDQVWIYGGINSNSLIGSIKADTIIGGIYFDGQNYIDIADNIDGGPGADSLEGGTGGDLFRYYGDPLNLSYSGSIANETINGGDGYDVIMVSGGVTDFSQSQIIDVESLTFVAASGSVTAIFNGNQLGGAVGFPIYDIIGTSLTAALTLRVTGTFADLGNLAFTNWDTNDQINITGTGAIDYLIGSSKADIIGELSNGGDDHLEGLGGDDTLLGGRGADYVDGGADYDFASYLSAANGVVARLDFASLNLGEAADDTYSAIEGLIGSAFNDFLVGDDALGNYLTAQGGDDYVAGRSGDDTIRGDDGNDQFWGGEGADSLDGGAGYDIARYDFAVSGVTVWLGGGVNAGEAAGDTFTGTEALYGSAFGDYLIGDDEANVLAALGGLDVLYGLGGDDILFGGAGGDFFAFNTAAFGTDTVLDFATTTAAGASHDYVDFRGIGTFTSFAITQSAANAVITTSFGTVILQNVSASTLVVGDFLF